MGTILFGIFLGTNISLLLISISSLIAKELMRSVTAVLPVLVGKGRPISIGQLRGSRISVFIWNLLFVFSLRPWIPYKELYQSGFSYSSPAVLYSIFFTICFLSLMIFLTMNLKRVQRDVNG